MILWLIIGACMIDNSDWFVNISFKVSNDSLHKLPHHAWNLKVWAVKPQFDELKDENVWRHVATELRPWEQPGPGDRIPVATATRASPGEAEQVETKLHLRSQLKPPERHNMLENTSYLQPTGRWKHTSSLLQQDFTHTHTLVLKKPREKREKREKRNESLERSEDV